MHCKDCKCQACQRERNVPSRAGLMVCRCCCCCCCLLAVLVLLGLACMAVRLR